MATILDKILKSKDNNLISLKKYDYAYSPREFLQIMVDINSQKTNDNNYCRKKILRPYITTNK